MRVRAPFVGERVVARVCVPFVGACAVAMCVPFVGGCAVAVACVCVPFVGGCVVARVYVCVCGWDGCVCGGRKRGWGGSTACRQDKSTPHCCIFAPYVLTSIRTV